MPADNEQRGTKSLKRVALELLEARKELPIWSARKALVRLIAENETVVLIGETGSGKTTQAPQLVLRLLQPARKIGCTQPRRVAAITIAKRVAAEHGCLVGETVGYSVRFDDCTTEATRINYVTDGMLIREAMIDPMLRAYSVIFVDEAHERTMNTDVLLGLLKRAQMKRRNTALELKLVIMSATLDRADFLNFFEGSVPAYIEGRQYPVNIFYTAQPLDSYMQGTLNAIVQITFTTCMQRNSIAMMARIVFGALKIRGFLESDSAVGLRIKIHLDEPDGTILAFLTGQDEIEAARAALEAASDSGTLEHPKGLGLHVVPVYGSLPPEEQAAAFLPAPDGKRKVVLATNIAETSVTIPGIRFVVDSGVVKARAYSAHRAIESLQVVPTSRAQAHQRAGRAGREAPGKCFRLYPEASFASLPKMTTPEIQRSNLATVVLQLKAIGVSDVLDFQLMSPPPRAALLKALEQLYALECIDSSGAITDKGRKMARLPLEPQYAAALLAADNLKCVWDCLAVVSMVSADRVFVSSSQLQEKAASKHRDFHCQFGDHTTALNVWRQYVAVKPKARRQWCRRHFVNSRAMANAADIFQQVQEHLTAIGIRVEEAEVHDDSHEALRQALVSGLFQNTAKLNADGRFRVLSTGQEAFLHPSSTLIGKKPKCIVYNELVLTSRPYAHMVSVIDSAWLPTLVPRYFTVASQNIV